MIYLKIDNSLGYYRKKNDDGTHQYISIDQIDKDDLFSLVQLALNSDFEMDNPSANEIKNPAHKIIYEKIFEKLSQIVSNRDTFMAESQRLFEEAITKYEDSDGS